MVSNGTGKDRVGARGDPTAGPVTIAPRLLAKHLTWVAKIFFFFAHVPRLKIDSNHRNRESYISILF